MVALVGTGVFIPLPVLTLLLLFRKLFLCYKPGADPLWPTRHCIIRANVASSAPAWRRSGRAPLAPSGGREFHACEQAGDHGVQGGWPAAPTVGDGQGNHADGMQ